MWKSTAGHTIANSNPLSKKMIAENENDPDDWDTDPDFINTVSEKEQRWGSKTIQGSGHIDSVDIQKLREEVKKDDLVVKKKLTETHSSINPSLGYGGKFGVQQDRVDKSAVGFEYRHETEKHSSQKDYSQGFGGKFGVENTRKDKSAMGFEHVEQLSKHSSQTDYSKGFGGKYGVENTKKDKSAVGFEHVEQLQKHSSQTDYSKGFGGKYGIETNKKDKSATGFDEEPAQVGTNYQRPRVDSKADIKGLKNRFENNALANDDSKKRAEEVRLERLNQVKLEKELEEKRNKNKAESVNNTNNTITSNEIAKPVLAYKAVSMSPFKNQEKKEFNNTSNNSQSNSNNSIGKSKISDQFLSQINQNKTGSNLSVSNNSTINTKSNNIIESNINKPIINIEPSNNQVKSPVLNNNKPSAFIPPPYKESDEDDEWADHGNGPIDIMPTNAPLAIFNEDETDESYHSPIKNGNHNNNDYHHTTNNTIQPVELNSVPDYYEQQQEQNVYIDESVVKNNSFSAVAIYDYQATDTDEISFDPNDIITDIVQVDEGWWQGRCKGNFGLFPANYVQII